MVRDIIFLLVQILEKKSFETVVSKLIFCFNFWYLSLSTYPNSSAIVYYKLLSCYWMRLFTWLDDFSIMKKKSRLLLQLQPIYIFKDNFHL